MIFKLDQCFFSVWKYPYIDSVPLLRYTL